MKARPAHRVTDVAALPGCDSSTLTRALYSSDASLYRVVPRAVSRPADVTRLHEVLDSARAAGIPVTTRGAGTSIAGNAVGDGVVVDCRDLDRILSIDAPSRLAVVEPGVVQARLTEAARTHGLRFGPDPSTSDRCTIGGMVGNNACGPRALGYGRTADNLVALDLVTGTGERLTVDSRTDLTGSDSPTLRALETLVSENLGLIRTEFGRFSRQVSGYSLEHLLPEKGFNVAAFLAGTEGTLATVTRATVRLVPDPPHTVIVALGYADMVAAADALELVLPFRPTACEGLDRRIIDVITRTRGAGAVPALPAGDGWMLVELADADPQILLERATSLVAAAGARDGFAVTDPRVANRLWRIRADGAGLAAVALDRPAHAGWEDAAVPPARLGAYLRAFEALLSEHQLDGIPYGHFGEGCVHVRIDFPLETHDGARRYRSFIEDAADLVALHGGSMSGEHGDGRARSELLPRMYSPGAIALFAAVKAVFDPQNLLNPGVLVDPRPLDAELRLAALRDSPLARLAPRFASEVHRCTGVGKCLADRAAEGGVMCPSYQATGLDKDSTRGRARVLQEMVNGTLVRQGWRSPEVREALELCLACKGCAADCPTGTDVARYKSEVLHQAYRHRLRPRTHYVLGWLPRWARVISATPGLTGFANRLTGIKAFHPLVAWLAGLDARRSLPRFAPRPARRVGSDHRGTREHSAARPVAVWVDSFSACFEGSPLPALLTVLTDAGWSPTVVDRDACCGLTLVTTGQRDAAARAIRASLDVLHPIVAAGIPIVGLEPSCLATWRSDAADLVDDPRVAEVAHGLRTLAELLTSEPDWRPPDLSGHTIVVQPHCHHASVLGWETDARLLAATGADVVQVAGCCGLAGNFGVEKGHYEVSVKVAEQDLLPAVSKAGPSAIVLADGFSCRTQLADLAGRRALTLADLLASHRR